VYYLLGSRAEVGVLMIRVLAAAVLLGASTGLLLSQPWGAVAAVGVVAFGAVRAVRR
jgi:hypothetical protein